MKKGIVLLLLLTAISICGYGQAYCHWEPPFHADEYFGPEPRTSGINYNPIKGWYITLDTSLQYGHPAFLLFARAHEYAHIYLHHGDVYLTNYNAGIAWNREMELEADSQAARWLIAAGCREAVVYQMMNISRLPYYTPPHYPSNRERAENLRRILALSSVLMPSLGAYASIGLSSLSGFDLSNAWDVGGTPSDYLGFEIGFCWNTINFGKNVALSTGYYYAQRGVNLTSGNLKNTLRFDEFCFPLTLNVAFNTSFNTALEFYAGVYYSPSYLLAINAEMKSEGETEWRKVNNFAQDDFGYVFGGHLVIKTFEDFSFLIGLKCQLGGRNFDLLDTSDLNPKCLRYVGLSLGCRYDINY